jgi:hypothetical protein
MSERKQLTQAQQDALALLRDGWTFTPGPRHMADPVPDDLFRGYPLRAHPPGPHAGPRPRVEQATLHALMRRGLVRRTAGRKFVLVEPRLSAPDRALFLLLCGWTIRRGPDFLDPAPCDLRHGPRMVLEPPPGYDGDPPAPVFQATIEVLVRDGAVVADGEAFVLRQSHGAGRTGALRGSRVSATT